jgi:hypothetical protein
VSIFWGLWLFPFGLLVIRSGFIPKVLGALLLLAGLSYLASSAASLCFPDCAPLVATAALPLKVGELPIVIWLLAVGGTSAPSPA